MVVYDQDCEDENTYLANIEHILNQFSDLYFLA